MHTLTSRASFWVVASVAAIALWTSAAPTVTYPLYAAEWHLTTSVTTAIFAIYPIVLVVVLVVFGNISDYIGRRAAILWGLSSSLIGVILFAVAPNVAVIFIGRAFMGIGVGLSLSPATAGVADFSAPGRSARAGSVTTASTALGIVLATTVGGALIQYAPFPTHLNFWVLAVVIAVVIAFAFFLPRHTVDEARGRWRPRALAVPRGIRRSYVIAAIAVTTGFTVGVVFLSLGADIAETLVGSSDAFVNGLVLALNAAVIGVTALVARRVPSTRLILVGGIAAIAGMVVLLFSSSTHSLALFLVSGVITGVGYSGLFAGGLSLITAKASIHHRAGMLSAVYLVAYLVQGSAALFLGAVATASGLGLALQIGAGIIAILSLGAIVLVLSIGRPQREHLVAAQA